MLLRNKPTTFLFNDLDALRSDPVWPRLNHRAERSFLNRICLFFFWLFILCNNKLPTPLRKVAGSQQVCALAATDKPPVSRCSSTVLPCVLVFLVVIATARLPSVSGAYKLTSNHFRQMIYHKMISQWFTVVKTAAMCISTSSLLPLSGAADRTGCFCPPLEPLLWLADCTLSGTLPGLSLVSFWHIHSGKHSWKLLCLQL